VVLFKRAIRGERERVVRGELFLAVEAPFYMV
jgi:hypothetical protein